MLTKIHNLVTGTVASKLGMGQQQTNWVRLRHREHSAHKPCALPVHSLSLLVLLNCSAQGMEQVCISSVHVWVVHSSLGRGWSRAYPSAALPAASWLRGALGCSASPQLCRCRQEGSRGLSGARAAFAGRLLCLLKSLPAFRSHAAFLFSMELTSRG